MNKLECPSCNVATVGVSTMMKAPTTLHIKCDNCGSILKLKQHNLLIAFLAFLVGIGLATAKHILKLDIARFSLLFLATIMVADILFCLSIVYFRLPLAIRKNNREQ
jgi:hypothetical protein